MIFHVVTARFPDKVNTKSSALNRDKLNQRLHYKCVQGETTVVKCQGLILHCEYLFVCFGNVKIFCLNK